MVNYNVDRLPFLFVQHQHIRGRMLSQIAQTPVAGELVLEFGTLS
jgi:hypothetical protein